MNISEPFIRRPVMTTLVMAAILLAGVMGYRALAVSELPNVDYPTIQVEADLPGANPDTMASAVAQPLEKQFSTIAGIDSMTSTSTLAETQITLQFDLSRSVDAAAQDVQSAISRVAGQLPPDMPSPPVFEKVNPADQPILFLALTSRTQPLSVVDQYAETMLAQRISMVKGVAQVQVFGSQKYAVRVQLDPQALAARQIGIDEVTAAVRNANVNLPTGTLFGEHKAYAVEASGQLTHASMYRPMIVAYRNGAPVRLDELGTVADSVQNNKISNHYNDEQAVILAIRRQPGTNTVEVVDAVQRILPQFQAILPPSISLQPVYDRSVEIRKSVSDVRDTLFLAICLVVLVIFLFLRNLSATVIPSIALPMSIIGTFATMYLLDYTIDNLSLMALTLAVGFVVDDAIVMLENIVRHVESGEGVMEAAFKGSREVGFTIVSMTLSLAAVFIPVLFMGGMLGRLLHEFSVVIMMAVLVSGVVSLTLTPMLCSRFIRSQHERKHSRMYMALERFFDALLKKYDHSLQWALRHRLVVIAISALILLATVWQFIYMPKGFLPETDESMLQVYTQAAQGISFEGMKAHQGALDRVALAYPNRRNFFSSVGMIGGTSNSGFIFVHLKEPSERAKVPNPLIHGLTGKYGGVPVIGALLRGMDPLVMHRATINEMMQDLRRGFSGVPGIAAYVRNPPPIQIGGQVTNSPYQVTLQSPDTDELYRVATDFEQKMNALPALQDVTTDLQMKNPQVNVNIDRDKASALGVTAEQVEDALYSAYGERRVSTILAPNDQYAVLMQLEDKYQRDPSALSLLYIRSDKGNLIPLSAVASLGSSLGPLSVNHLGQLPAVTLSFNLKPGVPIGDAVDQIDGLARQTLPATVVKQFQGTAQAFEASLTGLGILLLVAILVIYIVLGILYESFIHPLTILSGLPSAAFGALLTLQLFGYSLDLYGFVGVIMLIGIVKKNAIMMVDFAITREREGKTAAQAVYEGCLVRFRPIMMTTMAALMGTLPIAVGLGAGANSRRPLGVAVVGGLVFSQLVTLYLTPVFYTYMDTFQGWMERNFGRLAGFGRPRLTDETASAD